MSLTKVFNVAVRYGRTPPHQRHLINAAIEMEIERLARQEGEKVVFHRAVDDDLLGGGPLLLAEMTEDFAKKVEKISGVGRVEENTLFKTVPRPR